MVQFLPSKLKKKIKKKKENAAISALQENRKVATQRTIKLTEIDNWKQFCCTCVAERATEETDAQSQT